MFRFKSSNYETGKKLLDLKRMVLYIVSIYSLTQGPRMRSFTIRQKEIIDTAIRLIAERGIQALTIKNLSKIIGVSEPALYRHFENKRDILLGILTFFEQTNRDLFEKVMNSDRTEMEKLRSIFARHFKQFAANPALSMALFSEEIFQNDRRLAKKVFGIMNMTHSYLCKIIQDGCTKREFRNDIPDQHMGIVIMGALRLLVTKWRLSHFKFNLEEEGGRLWESLKKLIQKE